MQKRHLPHNFPYPQGEICVVWKSNKITADFCASSSGCQLLPWLHLKLVVIEDDSSWFDPQLPPFPKERPYQTFTHRLLLQMDRKSVTMLYYWTLLMINRTKRSLSVTATKLSPSFHYHFIAKPIIKRKLCLRNLLSKNWLNYLLENVLKIQSQIALEFIYGNNQYRAVCM